MLMIVDLFCDGDIPTIVHNLRPSLQGVADNGLDV